jgi:hypothetical protein
MLGAPERGHSRENVIAMIPLKIFSRIAPSAAACAFILMFAGCDMLPGSTPPPQQTIYVPVEAPAPQTANRTLLGAWRTTFKNGPTNVVVTNDERLRGANYIASAVDSSTNVPSGATVFKGSPDPNVPNLVVGRQMCPSAGYLTVRTVDATLTVNVDGSLTEDLKHAGECPGFPITWTRTASSGAK